MEKDKERHKQNLEILFSPSYKKKSMLKTTKKNFVPTYVDRGYTVQTKVLLYTWRKQKKERICTIYSSLLIIIQEIRKKNYFSFMKKFSPSVHFFSFSYSSSFPIRLIRKERRKREKSTTTKQISFF